MTRLEEEFLLDNIKSIRNDISFLKDKLFEHIENHSHCEDKAQAQARAKGFVKRLGGVLYNVLCKVLFIR